MHLGLKPSYTSPARLSNWTQATENAHVQGLLEHARLFAALDGVFYTGPTGLSADTDRDRSCVIDTLPGPTQSSADANGGLLYHEGMDADGHLAGGSISAFTFFYVVPGVDDF